MLERFGSDVDKEVRIYGRDQDRPQAHAWRGLSVARGGPRRRLARRGPVDAAGGADVAVRDLPTHDVGIDIGASKWLVVVDGGGPGPSVVARGATGAPDACLDAIAAAVVGVERGCSVGCAFPGAVDASGSVVSWPTRPDWVGVPLIESLQTRAGARRVAVRDDGLCAVIGESCDVDDALVLSLGTGIGSGFVFGGRVRGPVAGEPRTLGHVRALANGRVCVCGSVGCLQTALLTLPADDVIAASGDLWSDGTRLTQVCADVCRATGVDRVILTGGIMNRSATRAFLVRSFRSEGLQVSVADDPNLSAARGALVDMGVRG